MEHFWVVLGFSAAMHGVGSGGVRVFGPETSSDFGFSQFLIEVLGCF